MKDKLLGTLGICRKAGKLIMGFDPVAEAIALDQICLVLLAEDLSPKSAKELVFIAEKKQVPFCTPPILMDEIWSRLGRRSGILGVTDQGLATAVRRIIAAPTANKED